MMKLINNKNMSNRSLVVCLLFLQLQQQQLLLKLSLAFVTTTTNSNSNHHNIKRNLADDDDDDDIKKPPPFKMLTQLAVDCLLLSDRKRDNGTDGGSTGWTSWVDDAAAMRLSKCVDQIALCKEEGDDDGGGNSYLDNNNSNNNNNMSLVNDQVVKYKRWMKVAPCPMIIDLTPKFRANAQEVLDSYSKKFSNSDSVWDIQNQIPKSKVDQADFLERLGMHIIVLPSGSTLSDPLHTPTGGMIYGKALFGGVKRFRLLRSGRRINDKQVIRRTGEQTVLQLDDSENMAGWLQYGGPERNYEGLDIGYSAVLEMVLLPVRQIYELSGAARRNDLLVSNLVWDPVEMFRYMNVTAATTRDKNKYELKKDQGESNDDLMIMKTNDALERNNLFESNLVKKVGGLHSQIKTIVRRVLDGRVIRPVNEEGKYYDDNFVGFNDLIASEAALLSDLGLKPVKGLLLHGPPGCGKTAMAREIAKSLKARQPKIVSAPELLSKWVGGSEKLVRELFLEAEEELAECGGDPAKSALHIVVIDEIDAVFRRRGSSGDSGEATRASAVNQILTKLDGINELSNILVIGMTNRRELLDEALLRPGRLEVQLEIPLPDSNGRREILNIHFEKLRIQGRLSEALCKAIDGTSPSSRKRLWLNPLTDDLVHLTEGYSGADIEGMVRCAGSIALSRIRSRGDEDFENLLITLDDVKQAMVELKA